MDVDEYERVKETIRTKDNNTIVNVIAGWLNKVCEANNVPCSFIWKWKPKDIHIDMNTRYILHSKWYCGNCKFNGVHFECKCNFDHNLCKTCATYFNELTELYHSRHDYDDNCSNMELLDRIISLECDVKELRDKVYGVKGIVHYKD